MNEILALIGNPNSGKTTLFNKLTNSHEKVGNWSGVTVDKKEAELKGNKKIKVIDLPGIYGLDAKSVDEKVVLDFLKENHADCFINVVDCRNLTRSLRLTSLLLSYGVPTVIALNFTDKLNDKEKNKLVNKLESIFNVPVVGVSAKREDNIDELVSKALNNQRTLKPDKDWKNKVESLAKVKSKGFVISDKIDKVFTGKFTGIPVFFAIMFIVYFLTLKLGGFFSEQVSSFFDKAIGNSKFLFNEIGVPNWLIGLFSDGILKGIGSVVSFLPQIVVLFILLGVLEQTGYMARVTFLFDRLMKSIGISGKSMISLILSSGCTATGIMGARTIEDEWERKTTIYVSGFIPCGAKCAVFSWFSFKFFDGNVLVAVSMYFIGILTAIISSKILELKKKKSEYPFLLEIPEYSIPNLKNLFFSVYEKSKEFLIKAGSVIFVLSVFIWGLKNFGINGYTDGKIENSFIYYLGNALKYVFAPIGGYDWRASVSIISGIFAKEAVVETLELIGGDYSQFFSNGFSVYAFMTFVLLSPPCVASLAVAKKELNSTKEFIKMIIFQTGVAYTVSAVINGIGLLLNGKFHLIFISVLVIITVIGLVFGIKNTFSSCKNCKCIGDKKCHKRM